MSMFSRALEIEGQFVYVPGCMTISFDHSTTHRVFQGNNLGKLQDVHDINMDVTHDRLGVEVVTRRLDVQLTSRREAVGQDQEPDLELGPPV
ncbi:hypothetical protein E4U35_006638 [Claviceps purpurea]|nr:hypothetical protein E4U35_006638 [Claviceps purpurea]KAG6301844.1 hypothetical protein E4U45_003109 [Claviceps purpurea]